MPARENHPHRQFMEQALALARRGLGAVSPNPMVGAVVVSRGRVVGEGYHRTFGGRHAEVAALRAAGRRGRGATLYTNLEPCAHQGKTPPCADRIIEAGISRVVAAIVDPHSRVRGKGFRRLRQAGIEVDVGTLSREARRLNEAFLTLVTAHRPHVILKAGMSLDGRIAATGGRSRWITGSRSRARVQVLRRQVDAVLVGAGTVRADDPRLTARPGGRISRRQPRRVILDSRYTTPPAARLFRGSGGPVIIYGLDCHVARRRRLQDMGAEIVAVHEHRGHPDPRAVVADLGTRGVASLLVEGGGEVAWSFLDAGIADRLIWFVAPRLLGGGAVPVVGGQGVTAPADAISIRGLEVSRCGPDLVLEGTPVIRRRKRARS